MEMVPWQPPPGEETDVEVPSMLDLDASFEDLNLGQELLRGVYEMGFVRPSKIQAAALPHIAYQVKKGRLGQNVIGQAQNGSGKTATFALGLLTAANIRSYWPQAVCICPTRELAKQNEQVISQLGRYLPVEVLLAVPGQEIPRNAACHVVVGTPGKMLNLIQKRVVDTSGVRVFVLDEADVMLDVNNSMNPQITQIRKLLPNNLQIMFFSATYPDEVRQFAENLVPRALNIKVTKTELTVASVEQMRLRCKDDDDKFSKLGELYAALNIGQSIVFVNSRRKAFSLARSLKDMGHTVSLICGTQTDGEERMDPLLRDHVMSEFREGVTRVLIATDVLSRGIDVPQVTLVVNYELPLAWDAGRDSGPLMETYLHRVGRTGRFGLRGIAVNLVRDAEIAMVDEIEHFFACRIPEVDGDMTTLEERLRSLR